jgi:hypothetical protein
MANCPRHDRQLESSTLVVWLRDFLFVEKHCGKALMTNDLAAKQGTESIHHLKCIFEQSLAVLGEDKKNLNIKKGIRPHEPVRRDFLPLHIDPANLQKRALDDAAKALAALWKIPETGRTKPGPRAIVSHR